MKSPRFQARPLEDGYNYNCEPVDYSIVKKPQAYTDHYDSLLHKSWQKLIIQFIQN